MGDDFILVKMALFRCLSNKDVKACILKKKKFMPSKLQSIMYNSSKFPFSLKTKKTKNKNNSSNQSTRMKRKSKSKNYTTYLDVVGMGWIYPSHAYWLNVSQSGQFGGDVEEHLRHLDS